jgi:hypothetical protein
MVWMVRWQNGEHIYAQGKPGEIGVGSSKEVDEMSGCYDGSKRPEGSNADEWHLFLTVYAAERANQIIGLSFLAVQIAEAIEEAQERGRQLYILSRHRAAADKETVK